MSDFKAKMHQIRFRLGLRPDHAGRSLHSAKTSQFGSLITVGNCQFLCRTVACYSYYSALPDPLTGFKGPTFKGRQGGNERGKGGKGNEGKGKRDLLQCIRGIYAPTYMTVDLLHPEHKNPQYQFAFDNQLHFCQFERNLL